jgi:hypothetical protein
MQDGFEIGYVKAPYAEMPVLLVSPRAMTRSMVLAKYAHNTLLKKGFGICTKIQDLYSSPSACNSYQSFGNFECMPLANTPGKHFFGQSLDDRIEEFIQNGQAVNGNMPTNTDWLCVGHVDEVVSFSSDGTHVIVADSEVCWGLLLWAKSINSSAEMLEDMKPDGIFGPVTVGDVVDGHESLSRDFNVENTGVGACVMLPGNLPKVRSDCGLPANEPESTPFGVKTGKAILRKGGAFIGFFPGNPPAKRHFMIQFTSNMEYELSYYEAGTSWKLDRGGARRDRDEVFTKGLCFILKNWWDISKGLPSIGDTFFFYANPSSKVIEMPVLFWKENIIPTYRALNYTNNHVNCIVNGSKVLTAKSFGPTVDYLGTKGNILEDYAIKMFQLAGYSAAGVLTAKDLWYSNKAGSLHCGTNVEREIPSYNWWEK